MFLSKSIVWDLSFRYFFHLRLIFLYDVRKRSNFIRLYVDIQLLQHHLLKRLYFSTEWSWYPCGESIDFKCMDLLLDSQFNSIDLHIYPDSSTTQF